MDVSRQATHCVWFGCEMRVSPLQVSKCFFCILLTLAWWICHTAPRAVVAFLPVLVLPLFNIMSPDELASGYLSVGIPDVSLCVFL